MPELTLLKLLIASLRARLARGQPTDAGALSLELVAITVILLTIAGTIFVILRVKAQQSATRITLP